MCAGHAVKQAKGSVICRDGSDQQTQRAGKNGRRPENRVGNLANLLDRHAGTVYWLALYITGDAKDAEDVLQETFLKAHSDLPQFHQNESSVTWLVRIALSEALAKRRNRGPGKLPTFGQEVQAEGAFMPQEVVDWGDNPGKRYTSEKLRKIVHEGIQTLTPFSRIVFLLRDVASLRTEEIADLLRLPVPAIKSRLLQGRLQLRKHLNKYFKPS